MYLNIFILCFILTSGAVIAQNCEGLNAMSNNVDEIEKILIRLYNYKQQLERCKLRHEVKEKEIETALDSFGNGKFTPLEKWPPRSCTHITVSNGDGIYKVLLPEYSYKSFSVRCITEIDDGGWTVIQRRKNGSVNFFRNWTEYQEGFGDIRGEFFIGLGKLHALTNYNGRQELRIYLKIDNEFKYAQYSNFVIGNETESYALKELGDYSGNAGDSLRESIGEKFTTKDHYDHGNRTLDSEYEVNPAVCQKKKAISMESIMHHR